MIPLELYFGGWLKAPGMWDFAAYRDLHWQLSVEDFYKRGNRSDYRRDYFGLRGQYKDIKDIDILTVGGSTTDERFVSEGETWSDILGKCLRSRGYDADVANAGITGQSSVGHILNFHNWFNYISNLSPKYIIAFVGINERGVGGEWQKKYQDIRTYTEAAGKHDKWKTIRKWFRRNSAIYNFFKTIEGNLTAWRLGYMIEPEFKVYGDLNKKGKKIPGTEIVEKNFMRERSRSIKLDSPEYYKRLKLLENKISRRLRDYHERLDALTLEIRKFGATPVYATNIRADYRIKGDTIFGNLYQYFELEPYHQITRSHCKKNGLLCVDVSRKMNVNPGDFFDIMHTAPPGSRKIGQTICDKILDEDSIILEKK